MPVSRGSSVVERVIGNDEVESSIPSRGTILPLVEHYHVSMIFELAFEGAPFSVLSERGTFFNRSCRLAAGKIAIHQHF